MIILSTIISAEVLDGCIFKIGVFFFYIINKFLNILYLAADKPLLMSLTLAKFCPQSFFYGF